MLFGEYLIQQGLVQADHILVALIEQLRTIPSTCELVFECQLIEPEAIFRALTYQQRHGIDFQSSAEALGIWSSEVAARVNSELQKRRRPLGEILVQKGFLSLQTLSSALDSYV